MAFSWEDFLETDPTPDLRSHSQSSCHGSCPAMDFEAQWNKVADPGAATVDLFRLSAALAAPLAMLSMPQPHQQTVCVCMSCKCP